MMDQTIAVPVCTVDSSRTMRLDTVKALIRYICAAALALAFLAHGVAAQDAAKSASPTFDLASIRLNNSGIQSSHWTDRPGKIIATDVTLLQMISRAYRLRTYQISGPEWLGSVRYDITAEAGTPAKKEERALMLQSLLSERFGLVVHREQKLLPVYNLTLSQSAPKLQAVTGDGRSTVNSNRGHLLVQKGSMAEIAEGLSGQMERPVLDATGLKGVFNVDLQWTPEDSHAEFGAQADDTTSDTSGPSIFTAVRDQLGLKLVPAKGMVDILVVDHVEKVPTEN